MTAVSRRHTVSHAGRLVVLVDSITQTQPVDAGAIVVSGSHAGLSAASFALAVPARLYVFNDAGRGKGDAGIAGLEMLDRAGIAAAAVSHDTARIGEALDTLKNGVISSVNGRAAAMGLTAGVSISIALESLPSGDF